jgi:hypothetical protein
MKIKSFLFIPIFLVVFQSSAQDNFEVIGNPIKIGNLLICEKDFSNEMNWYDAKKISEDLGVGWRLPTRKELNVIYLNRKKLGISQRDYYWSSSELNANGVNAWFQNFRLGYQETISKQVSYKVRAVKNFN